MQSLKVSGLFHSLPTLKVLTHSLLQAEGKPGGRSGFLFTRNIQRVCEPQKQTKGILLTPDLLYESV